jgi:arabinogalactan endo-1,4-beta-galactosidase
MKRFVLITLLLSASLAHGADPEFFLGGDVSALSETEKCGVVYRDNDKPADVIDILRHHGCNLFRLRLFVNPSHDASRNFGPTQDLAMVLALSKRIRQSGASLSLALHYSDTWADPGSQTKPAQWKDLSFPELQNKVTDYTASVLAAMKSNGTPPDIVEVGNETTTGMLWPDGKLGGATAQEKMQQWDNYARLLKAGTSAVRSSLPAARIMVHISAGGRAGVPTWFFGELKKHAPDFDIIGLSFYPTFNDRIDDLKKNLAQLAPMGKDILIIEAAYPYKPEGKKLDAKWPLTPMGQKQFLDDLIAAVKGTPDHRGIGVCWWYPEAVPIKNRATWEGGSMGLFDPKGQLLPAMSSR